MNEIDDIKRRAGIITESVIHNQNPSNMSNPDVKVNGVGIYSLDLLKNNVKKKIVNLALYTKKANDAHAWTQISYMLNHVALQEMVKTIISAEEELGGTDIERH